MMDDIYKTTADRLRAALSAEWCDLYGHKTEWNEQADKAEDTTNEAYKEAYRADDINMLPGEEIDALYDLADELDKDARTKRERVDRLEKAMELIEQLETLYADDWKEV